MATDVAVDATHVPEVRCAYPLSNFIGARSPMTRRASFRVVPVVAALSLSACATPARMHDEAALNNVALGCGLALGELVQDEEQKKLLLLIHDNPSAEQRTCVTQWARRNGLKPVFVNMQFPEG